MRRAFHSSLVVDEMNGVDIVRTRGGGDHDIPALKIAEHKILVLCVSEVSAKRLKVVDQFLFVIGFSQGIEEIIFEIQ